MDDDAVIERLQSWGCDTTGALARVVQNRALYVRLIRKYKDTFPLEELRALIVAEECDKAFAVAHELKGSLGNLGLTPMYTLIREVVEGLRHGCCDAAILDSMDILLSLKSELDAICK